MRVYEDFDLTNYNSYQVKAKCKRAYFPENDEDILELFYTSKRKYILLGAGYNVLLAKEYYEDEFVIFSGNFDNVKLVDDNKLLCESGCDMKVLSEFALEHSLSGIEIFYDIPSSLGGAVVMNAGASGEDIRGVLVKVWYLDPNSGTVKEITNEEIGFEYRNSFFQKNPEMIVCRALLELKKGDRDAIKSKMDLIKTQRWAKQPRDFPNAGSVFKRPPGRFVGPMIDELNLKGYAVGGAKVSEKHGGFIINYNDAKGQEILDLIHHVKNKVFEAFGVDLEIEQRII